MTRTNGIQHLLYCNVGQPRPGYFVSRLPQPSPCRHERDYFSLIRSSVLSHTLSTDWHPQQSYKGRAFSIRHHFTESCIAGMRSTPQYKSTAAPKPRSPGRTRFVYRILAILTRSSHESSTSLASAVRSACMVMERTKQGRRDSRRTSNRTFSSSAPTQATLSW